MNKKNDATLRWWVGRSLGLLILMQCLWLLWKFVDPIIDSQTQQGSSTEQMGKQ